MTDSEDVTTAYEAHSPGQLAAEIARADSVKLRFDEEVYPLTKLEIEWIVFALRHVAEIKVGPGPVGNAGSGQ